MIKHIHVVVNNMQVSEKPYIQFALKIIFEVYNFLNKFTTNVC